jgi:hypothetical protein
MLTAWLLRNGFERNQDVNKAEWIDPPDIADPAWPCYWPSHGAKSSPARIGERTLVPRLLSPLALACDLGELEVCKWLHARGADVRKSGARNGITPMIIACERGHLDVCQWLYEVGAAADIRKCENFGFTPMMWACQAGQLSVCKWLFEMGAAADVTRPVNGGITPLCIACQCGHMSICQWLFEVGAAAHISQPDQYGRNPMKMAVANGHFGVCQWLASNGAVNDPDTHHVGLSIVDRLTTYVARSALLENAQAALATHHTFLNVVLRASVIHRKQSTCLLPLLPRGVLQRIAAFAGVEAGRRQRNLREFCEALETLKFDDGTELRDLPLFDQKRGAVIALVASAAIALGLSDPSISGSAHWPLVVAFMGFCMVAVKVMTARNKGVCMIVLVAYLAAIYVVSELERI